MTQTYGSTDRTNRTDSPATVHNDTQCPNDNNNVVSDFRRALPQFCVVGVKNLILLGWGLILGYPTILIPGLQGKHQNDGNSTAQPDFLLTDDQISWIGSINLLCVPIGSITSGLLMEPLGKRRMMQLLNVPMLFAWALFYFSTDISHIYMALCLSGMSGGLLEAPLLIYIAETVEPRYRGMLTASGTATALGGVCLSFIIGSMLHWRTVAAISAVVPFFAILAVFLVPESPYWLYAKNRVDDAHKSLQWLRGWVSNRNVEEEFKDVISSVEDLKSKGKKKSQNVKSDTIVASHPLKPFTQRTFIAPFLLILFGFIVSHFSGLTPLQTYSIQILNTYHVPINEYYATIFLGAAQVIGCLIGMVFVRSTGKRGLVFASFIGCGVCFCSVATYSHFSTATPQQFDLKPNAAVLNARIDRLEQNVLNCTVSLRNRYQIERDTGNIARINATNLNVDPENVNANIYRHIDQKILAEAQQLLHDIQHLQSFGEMKPKPFNESIEQLTTTTTNNNTKTTISNIDAGQSSIQMNNSTHRDEINADKLLELLNITKNIIVTFLPNVIPKNDDSNLTMVRLDEIERDMRRVLLLNVSIEESQLVKTVNELVTTLSNVEKKIRLGSLADTNTSSRWIPLILLLGGSMFAHCGAKLFPWMLIGEVYPMDVRSAAAGISSALGYLVGFLSNKLFINMVAEFSLNGTFWFYSAVSLIGVIVLYFTLPETENRTLIEIQAFFVKQKSPTSPSSSSPPPIQSIHSKSNNASNAV